MTLPLIGPHLCLEARVQVGKKRMAAAHCQHSLLCHCALNIVILQHRLLLENFDGKHLTLALQFGKHHLSQMQNEEVTQCSLFGRKHKEA